MKTVSIAVMRAGVLASAASCLAGLVHGAIYAISGEVLLYNYQAILISCGVVGLLLALLGAALYLIEDMD